MKRWLYIPFFMLLTSCAQMAMPTGGDKDILPPKANAEEIVPRNGSTNFDYQRIYIEFDEYIRIQPGRQPVISPPLSQPAEITAKGKRLMIELPDNLQPNTTYTIHLPAMVTDITESNVLEDFTYVFSTGNTLDSGLVEGKILNAFTRAPVQKAWALLYSDTARGPLKNSIPAYIARSGSNGNFSITHVKPATYRLFVLTENDADFTNDNPGEWVGFYDSIITIGKTSDTKKIFLFKPIDKNIRVVTDIAISPQLYKVTFNQSVNKLRIQPIGGEDNLRQTWVPKGDSVVHIAFGKELTDTAHFEIVSDQTVLDTFFVLPERNKKYDYTITLPANRTLLPNETVQLSANSFSVWDSVQVTVTDTTTRTVIKNVIFTNGIIPAINFPHAEEVSYKITLNKGALSDVKGEKSDSTGFYIRWMPVEKYGTVKVMYDFSAAVSNGSVVIMELFRASPLTSDTLRLTGLTNTAFFKTVRAAGYTLRVFVDLNGDGRWTTGNLEQKIQPEPSFVYPQQVQVRANWDLELNWKPE